MPANRVEVDGRELTRGEWRTFQKEECPHLEWGPVVTVTGMGPPLEYRVCDRCKLIVQAWAAGPRTTA